MPITLQILIATKFVSENHKASVSRTYIESEEALSVCVCVCVHSLLVITRYQHASLYSPYMQASHTYVRDHLAILFSYNVLLS